MIDFHFPELTPDTILFGFIDTNKYQKILSDFNYTISHYWDVVDKGHSDVNAERDTFYCIDESALRFLLDRPGKQAVPIWEKSLLTVEEATMYTGLGLNKLRQMCNARGCPFVVKNGRKLMIKRKQLDEFLYKSLYV